MADTVESLHQKIRGAVAVNEGIVQEIEARLADVGKEEEEEGGEDNGAAGKKKGQVISGYRVSLGVDLDWDVKEEKSALPVFGRGDTPGKDYKIEAVPVYASIAQLISAWKYAGEELKPFEDFFGDVKHGEFDYKLETYDDAKRLHRTLPLIAEKWGRFAKESAENVEQMRVLLHDVGTITGALGGVQELTIDARNPLDGQEDELNEEMDNLVAGWGRIAARIHKSQGVTESEGQLKMDLKAVSGDLSPAPAVQFGVDPKMGSNLQVSDQTVTKRGGDGYQGSSFTVTPDCSTGKHTVRLKVQGLDKSSGFWVLMGVVESSKRDEFISSESPDTTPTIFGAITNGFVSTAGICTRPDSFKILGEGTVRLEVDCAARTLTIVHEETNNECKLDKVPVPCVFSFCLWKIGSSITFL